MRRWDFRLVSSKRGLEAVGKYVCSHIIGRSKVFDLFPRTHKGKNRCVLSQKHALINSRERPLKSDINLEQSSHVETVVKLVRKAPDAYIDITVDMDELDLTASEAKATYEEIKQYILDKYDTKVSNLYIAQVKEKYGIIERENYNKPKSENSKQPQCPAEKVEMIEEALRHFKMI